MVATTRRLGMGMLTGAFSVLVKTGLNLLLIPVLLSAVGVESYGLYVLLMGTLELFILLDLGFSSALIRLLGANLQADSSPYAAELLRAGHWLYLVLAVIGLLIGLFVIPMFPSLFTLPSALHVTAYGCLTLVLAEGLLTLYTYYFRAVMFAHSQHQWVNTADTLFYLVANVAGLAALLLGYGLVWVFVWRVAAAVLRTLVMLVVSFRLDRRVFALLGPMRVSTLREIALLSFHAAMVNLSVQISHKIDTFVIAFFLPLSAVGVYEIVFRFVAVVQQISLKITEGVFPLYARMASLSQSAEARRLFLRMSSLVNFVTLGLLVLIVSFYPELFRMLSSGKIPVAQTLPILLLAIPIIWTGSLQMPASPYLFASGRQRYLSVSSMLAALSNLFLSLALVQPLGLVGVALGTLIPQLVQHQASLIRETCRDLGIGFREYVYEVHLKVLPAMIVAIAWIHLLRPLFNWQGWPILPMALLMSTAGLLGLLVWARWGWSEQDRSRYWGWVTARVPVLRGAGE